MISKFSGKYTESGLLKQVMAQVFQLDLDQVREVHKKAKYIIYKNAFSSPIATSQLLGVAWSKPFFQLRSTCTSTSFLLYFLSLSLLCFGILNGYCELVTKVSLTIYCIFSSDHP